MGRLRAVRMPRRWLSAAAAVFLASVPEATSAGAAPEKPYIAEIMPPATCVAAPDRACLLAAYQNVVSRYDNRQEGTKTGSLRLFIVAQSGLNDPAVDALVSQSSPYWTADRLKARRAELTAQAAKPSVPSDSDVVAPSPTEMPAEQAGILATADEHRRMWRTDKVIRALARAGRSLEAEKLLAVVQRSMRGRDTTLRDSVAVTAARSFAEAGAWPAWSRSLTAGGYPRMMADATMDSDPEVDPTEVGILEPLRLGIPVEDLLPWVARAKNPAFRDHLLLEISKAAFERGRVSAWRSDVEGVRRHVVAATARGEFLHHPDNPFDRGDETLFRFCWDEARQHGDRVLALVAALQAAITPPSEDDVPSHDRVRERVLVALADAMLAATR